MGWTKKKNSAQEAEMKRRELAFSITISISTVLCFSCVWNCLSDFLTNMNEIYLFE